MSNDEGRRRSASRGGYALNPEALDSAALGGAARVFTIPEINALIPSLSLIVAQQLRDQSDIERGLAELTRRLGRAPMNLEVQEADSPEARRLKLDLRQRIGRYERGWNQVRALGGVVKDAQIGLVDFYGRINGRLVWLCWRYGEDALEYFHDLDSGYSGRRAIGADVRKSYVN